MDWKDVIIKIDSKDLEITTAILQMISSRGIYIEDYSDFDDHIQQFGPIEKIEESLLNEDRTMAKIHIYFNSEENSIEDIFYIKERFNNQKINYEIETNLINEEDWANNWKKHFKPCPIGNRLIIVPSWEKENINPDILDNRIPLIIDPGMAFGSGQHETTRLCMKLIEEYVLPGMHVLDVGTGSGILSITALLLGAASSTGIDIDALSVKVASENAALNNVGNYFTPIQGDLAKDIDGNFNLIAANIVADIIIDLSPDAVKLLSSDGIYIMSGIIMERRTDVLNSIQQLGLYVIEERTERGWCAIAAGKMK